MWESNLSCIFLRIGQQMRMLTKFVSLALASVGFNLSNLEQMTACVKHYYY